VQQNEKLQTGYVIKTGPGYALPNSIDETESWKKEKVKYLPLEVEVGDLAIYLQSSGFEVMINDEKYLILSHASILMLVRDEDLFG
jgi:co-chaperonin GroES (HSP10)